ncbi:chemocyanin-like [Oryza brachyantha]|uniref:chemocyanin-like n=1 Tax=Oryza brachyantha TaxID=4533 RepID=UPI001ADCA9AD|nr:chemocyanin-like [Oryza brachyantha]
MMVAASLSSLLAAVAIMASAASAGGTSYTVGEPGGAWDLGTNLTAWASAVDGDLHPGDQLVFRYDASAHDVVEVTLAGYRSCSAAASSAVSAAALRTGSDAVRLDGTGTRYFICSVPGHCGAGMKLRVRVVTDGAGCNSSLPSLAPAPPGAPAPAITICPGGPPTVIMTPGVISYSAAPRSSDNLSSVLVAMASLLLGVV